MTLRPGLQRLVTRSQLHRAVLSRRLYSSFGQTSGQAASQRWFYALVGVNTAVFAAWKYADNTISLDFKSHLSPETYRQLSKYIHLDKRQLLNDLYTNFTVKPNDSQNNRWWTAITSTFSHIGLGHFAFNMIAFKSFAEALIAYCPGIRPSSFLSLCLGSGLAGSLGWLYTKQTSNDRSGNSAALGASGMVTGAATAVAMIAPHAKWGFIFIPIGIPAWAMLSAYIAYDAFYMNDQNSRVGHSGHLGGAAFGAAYYMLVLRRLRLPGGRF